MRVCGLIVCFEPELETIQVAVGSVSGQVDGLIVIDNGSSALVSDWLTERERAGTLSYLKQETNVGLAAAQNIGIGWVRRNQFTHVLLLDQDSVPSAGMVDSLSTTLAELEAGGTRVGAVGPQIILNSDDATVLPFIRLGLLGCRCYAGNSGQPVEVDILISSGALIPIAVIGVVGEMDEKLFIDNVDVDWCFRAKHCAFELFGDGTAHLKHRLGNGVRRVWFFRWRNVIVHQPERLFYFMRNRVKLYTKSYTPWLWIVQDWYRLCAKLVLFTMFVPPRYENLKMMLRGLLHGVMGKGGAHAKPP